MHREQQFLPHGTPTENQGERELPLRDSGGDRRAFECLSVSRPWPNA